MTPEYRQAARSGAFLVVHDTHGDPLTYASAHATLQVRAFMSVPFIRDGAWKFMFSVCDSRPHGWRDQEVSLFRQLADWLFARLEQALAEQAVANDLRDTQLLRDLSCTARLGVRYPGFFRRDRRCGKVHHRCTSGLPSAARRRCPRAGARWPTTASNPRRPNASVASTRNPRCHVAKRWR